MPAYHLGPLDSLNEIEREHAVSQHLNAVQSAEQALANIRKSIEALGEGRTTHHFYPVQPDAARR